MYVNTKQDIVSTPNYLGAYKNCGVKYEVSGLVNLWRSQSLWWTRAIACQSIVRVLEERCTLRTITRTLIDSRRVMMTMTAMTQRQKQKWQSMKLKTKWRRKHKQKINWLIIQKWQSIKRIEDKDTTTRRSKENEEGNENKNGIENANENDDRSNMKTTATTKLQKYANDKNYSQEQQVKPKWWSVALQNKSDELVGEVNHS